MPPQNLYPDPNLQKNPGSPPRGPAEPPPQATTPIPQMPAAPPAPHRPPGQFDFMLNDPQAPKAKFSLPSSGPAKIFIVLIAITVFILLFALIFGGGGSNNYQQIVGLMAQNNEIIRVSGKYQDQLSDTRNSNLAATVQTTLTSQQDQFANFLAANKFKYKQTALGAAANSATDTTLDAAVKDNQLDSAYLSYLSSAIQTYQKSLQSVFATTKPKSFCIQSAPATFDTPAECTETIGNAFTDDYTSNKVLLESPQFSS